MPDLENDPRLDPRVKWALRNVPVTNLTDVDSRETLLEISNHPKAVAMRERIDLSRTAFVGDSSNDVWIAREAGFTVGFNPKTPEFEEVADAVVRSDDLREILPHLLDDRR